MAGHSKWAIIQHRKGRQDAKRARSSPSDQGDHGRRADGWRRPELQPATAPRRRQRQGAEHAGREHRPAIKRGTGELDGVSYVEIRYEGYGIAGAAVMVDCLTDNKTRTSPSAACVLEVRRQHGFRRLRRVPVQALRRAAVCAGTDGMCDGSALEAGAEDVVTNDDGSIEILTAPYEYRTSRTRWRKRTQGGIRRSDDEAAERDRAVRRRRERMQKLLDALESLDDVQEVYTSALWATESVGPPHEKPPRGGFFVRNSLTSNYLAS